MRLSKLLRPRLQLSNGVESDIQVVSNPQAYPRAYPLRPHLQLWSASGGHTQTWLTLEARDPILPPEVMLEDILSKVKCQCFTQPGLGPTLLPWA